MNRIHQLRITAAVCFAGLLVTTFGPLHGDDEKPSKPAEEKNPATTEAEKPEAKDPQTEWKELSARKLEIAKQLRTLQAEFKKAGTTEAKKKDIRDQFSKLVSEYRFDIEAKMRDLAEAVYKANPDNSEAAEAVMDSFFNKNQYTEALEIAKRLLESGGNSRYAGNLAINVAGAASFCLNRFDEAEQYFNQATEKKQLNELYGERFAEYLPAYKEFWKREAELRARDAKLEGDKQLPMVELTIGDGKKELGKVVLELFEEEAPNTVANFISIVEGKEQNYNGVKFHRVLSNFMAQTGNLEASGKTPLDYTIKCECYSENARKHFRGSVSMALKGKDTGDSQFFITHLPTYWLNEEVRPDSVHTVFGRVVEGMEIIDQVKQDDVIISAKVLFKRPHDYKPDTVPNEKPDDDKK